MSDQTIFNNKPTILPYQKAVYEKLCAYARASLLVDRKSISSLKLRTNFLLLGPTGTGKTFLAKEVARELKVPFLAVSVSDWIILGGTNRGSTTTWPIIYQFIQRSKSCRGAIIFIDELDKCYHDSNWNSFLRSEIFSLCDARIPVGLNDPDDEDTLQFCTDEAEDFLSNKTMIIGGAAFQSIWEDKSARKMGFQIASEAEPQTDLTDLVKYLPRELINRFSSELFILPRLERIDYLRMIEFLAEMIPDIWRKRFLELGIARIDQAIHHQKGVRYAEEILLAAIVAERTSMANFVAEFEDVGSSDHEPDKPDDSMFVF